VAVNACIRQEIREIRVDFRWERKPGLTGLAQLLGAASSQQTLDLDRAYTLRIAVKRSDAGRKSATLARPNARRPGKP